MRDVVNDKDASSIRVLVVDDEPGILESYREVLAAAAAPASSPSQESLSDLRAKLFAKDTPKPAEVRERARFELTECNSAAASVEAVRESIATQRPFAVIFLDMRMPPGEDGAWAAEHIRAIDENVSIVLCSAYSDVDTEELCGRVPPEDKFFFSPNRSTRRKCGRWRLRSATSGAPNGASPSLPTTIR